MELQSENMIILIYNFKHTDVTSAIIRMDALFFFTGEEVYNIPLFDIKNTSQYEKKIFQTYKF